MAVKSYQAQAEGEISLSKGEKIKGEGEAVGRRARDRGGPGSTHSLGVSQAHWRPQRALSCPLLPGGAQGVTRTSLGRH